MKERFLEGSLKYIRGQLEEANLKLAEYLGGDCIFIHSEISTPLDITLKDALEDMPNNQKCDHLIVLLQTKGGYIELVERLVNIMRYHYQRVSFVIPSHAYSAGTVLVLSGDEIFMCYYSVLGPIDPQYELPDGSSFPGQGIIWGIDKLIDKINSAQSSSEVRAELAMLHELYDPAEIFLISQNIELGQSLIKKWLPKYKFKDWNITETRKLPVSEEMKLERAGQISKILCDAEFWHSHGRGIPMESLMEDDINLKINDYREDEDLCDLIENYYRATTFFLELLNVDNCIHTRQTLWRV